MKIKKLLIANRGEIAIRIARAAAGLGISTVAVYSADDQRSLHISVADEARALDGKGSAAYLDIDKIIDAAVSSHCDAIHPGYGFLSENADFARCCSAQGIIFVGPTPEILDLFGNKAAAIELARKCGGPVLRGTAGAASLEEAKEFFKSLGDGGAVMIKSVYGGGGRGIRIVNKLDDIEEAYVRCQSEARKSFGRPDVYVEQMLEKPRHIEVQVVGDGRQVIHLGLRDCTLQRRNQKLIEVSPCPSLPVKMRARISDSALHIAGEAGFLSLGTVEFLVDERAGDGAGFAFIEVNPRLQVEHTVTEEVTGVDLVGTQIELAEGSTLESLGHRGNAAQPKVYAVQLRINAETMDDKGNSLPGEGVVRVYEVPSGPGIRVDGYGYAGYRINSSFDSLLAKLVVTSRSTDFSQAVAKAGRALGEFRIEGIKTNIPFLRAILGRPEIVSGEVSTRFVEDNAGSLAAAAAELSHTGFDFQQAAVPDENGAVIEKDVPPGTVAIRSHLKGCVVDIEVLSGDMVVAGQKLMVLESMKMEHVITADRSGYVRAVCVELGDVAASGSPLLYIEEAEVVDGYRVDEEKIDLDSIRPDLAHVIERHAYTLDENRPEAVSRRHDRNQRTARENIEDLCDRGSFIEYGALTVALQRKRRSMEDLMKKTPADGFIAGIGTVNGALFDDRASRCMVMAYDFTVLAGTQGLMGHKKLDRVLHIANQWELPIVLFAEGGGGRPGDTDANVVAALDIASFSSFAALSGKIPLIGIVEGPCFAGNAALLGCCDVIIATKSSSIGMGGPAMIEGGGLGVVRPEQVGPIDIQTRNGVVDIAVENESEAVSITKKYLSYYQGPVDDWDAADQRMLRWLIPENRVRVYDVRSVIETLADRGSVLELRPHFGPGMVTSLVRIEGRSFGLLANDSKHMGGAIEAEDADKAARFMQLCDAYGLPILSLVDTPGFMVGPDIETRAQVRHVCRMFIAGSHVSVPFFTIVLRKGYGLGAMAMTAGSFHGSFFTTCWPTGEFGGMGLEGAVKHGFKKELAAIKDPAEREATYKFFVEQAYEMGKATNTASFMEIDAVIDPAETRRWIMRGLKSLPAGSGKKGGGRYIDAW